MENPFLKRVTETFQDEEAFLAIVSPEPVKLFLLKPGKNGQIYDRLVFIRGTPGSGKTTLARLFEYPTIAALLRNKNIETHRSLVRNLIDCKAITDSRARILACRLNMESDYRNFWEFPYTEELKLSLMHKLIQSRAVLGWISNLVTSGIPIENIKFIAKKSQAAASQTIGGTEAASLLELAKSIELSLYKVIGALVAPEVSDLDENCKAAYHPFDIIQEVVIESEHADPITLTPLVILDDAHVLHPAQFDGLQRWLLRRELSVARWVLTRLDVMHAQEALARITEDKSETFQLPGITVTRETTEIMLQSNIVERKGQRAAFRKMAKDMAGRYLNRIPLFSDRNLVKLSNLLSTTSVELSTTKLNGLKQEIKNLQSKLVISNQRRAALLEKINQYSPVSNDLPEDIKLAMLAVLMNRYAKRVPQHSLFDEEEAEPKKELNVDITVYDAARIHLFHKYERPYYIGIDDLCDASSENAEQFLHLAAVLVEAVATRLIHSRQPSLDSATQHKLLRDQAEEAIDKWNFPQFQFVKQIINFIANKCLEVSLFSNAPLGQGANAYGILKNEFDEIPEAFPDLARVLQFGIAYNALTIVPRYECKGQVWCLLELGGLPILKHGLTLKRGGFIEGDSSQLNNVIKERAAL